MTAQESLPPDSTPGPVPAAGASPVAGADVTAAARGMFGKRWMKPLVFLASLVGALTIFDGVATWYEVAVMQVAEEGNPILRALEGAVGFTGSMVIRVVSGLALLAGIVYVANRGLDRARRLFVLGLFVCVVAFVLLAFYHAITLWNFTF